MDVAALSQQLSGTRFATLRWVGETGSTNDDLLHSATQGAPDGTVLITGHQTAGRGRLDRRWEAPAGSSLLCSVLLRPLLAPTDWHLFTTAMGVAAAQAIETVCGVRAGVKWPNDLVVEDAGGTRKVAGILAEAAPDAQGGPALVVGIGVNVRWPSELPAELASIATSLNHLTGEPPSAEQVLVALLHAFDSWCHRIDVADPDEGDAGAELLRAAYRERSATIGRRVHVERTVAEGPLEGTAVDVDADGRLIVESADGATVAVTVGDVVHLQLGAGGG